MKIRDFLMSVMEIITQRPRYHPEEHELSGKMNWSSKIWISNIFRLYEYIFGREYGIRAESSASVEIVNGKFIVHYNFFTVEAFLAHIEATIRLNLYLLFVSIKSILECDLRPEIDYRPAIVTFGVLGLIFNFHISEKYLPIFGMAIAYDASANSSAVGLPANSLTHSHTCTGSNLFLVASVCESGGATGSVSGITYNSAGLTSITNVANAGGNVKVWTYYLINPSTGANNTVTSLGSSDYYRCFTTSYTGAKQSAQPDGNNTNSANNGTSITTTVTTTADNCWNYSFCGGDGGNVLTGSTGITSVRDTTFNSIRTGDSNAPKTPAGSYSMTWTCSAQNLAVIQISIAPVAGNIKSIGSVAYASVKKAEGVVIASVKKIAGLA